MTHLSKIAILLTLTLFATACSSDSSPNKSDADHDIGHDTSQPDADAEQDTAQPDVKDNEDEEDPNCHHDCWSGYNCKDGKVYQGTGSPLPCSEANEQFIQTCNAGYLVGTCEAGCVENIEFPHQIENPDNSEDPWKVLCNESLPTECTVTLELSDSLITIPTTWPTPLAANSRPLICWETPQDATLPADENGWQVVVQREDKVVENPDSNEWLTTLLPVETRQIHYGNCDLQPTNCTTANNLTPGKYFIHILEPNNPTGLAASLVVTVE